MASYDPQQLNLAAKKLPYELRDAIFSVDTAEKISELGKKHGLTMVQVGLLADAIGTIMLGSTRPQEFTGALAKGLAIDVEKAKALARDVNIDIFAPIRDALKRAHQFEISMEELQKTEFGFPRPAPKPATAPQSRTETPAATPRIEPPTDAIVLQPKEPKTPLPPAVPTSSKVAPIDLRELAKKPAPGTSGVAPKPATTTDAGPTPEKKKPYGGIDPYKEPVA